MWFSRRKKITPKPEPPGPACSHCGSTNTRLIVYHGADQPNYVRVWRGQRFLTYRCLDCGRDYYGEEPPEGITNEVIGEDRIIDDEEALRAAEEEIKRQVEEDDDRTCH